MHNKSLLIKNGSIVHSGGIVKSDIFILNGKISEIGLSLECKPDQIIDAEQKYVFPGIIDPQVHFRDPGLTHKEDLHTGSMAAAAGGVTTFFEMPNTNPSTTSIDKLNDKYNIANEKSLVNYSFFPSQKFTSTVSYNNKKKIINTEYIQGPLKDLFTEWSFLEIDINKTKIIFNVGFEFKDFIHQKIALLFLPLIEKNMIKSFIKRADELLN